MNDKLYQGSEIILKSLEKEKIKYVFGYPGGSVLPLYDSLYKNNKIKHILTRHEQAAGHAADGYYRATGKIGVVFATSGPGATNLITAIATAQMDSIPIIVITGQVAIKFLGKQAFQEAPITEIVKSITKYSKIIYKVEDISKEIKKAFEIANLDRKGPVLLDIPKDIMIKKSKFFYPIKKQYSNKNIIIKNDYFKNKCFEIINILQNSKKPLIFVGGGAINATCQINKLNKKLNIPIVYSLMGKGIINDKNSNNLGMIGMHGMAAANYAIQSCDVLFAIGVRFDDREIGNEKRFAKNAKIIHLNIDQNERNKNIFANIFICEDSKKIISELLKLIKKENFNISEKWIKQVLKWKNKYSLKFKKEGFIKPQEVLLAINKITKGNAIMVTEVGQHQMWAAQYYDIKNPINFITSGGLGTMGFGLPASIGAQIGKHNSLVILFAGDGSIQMNSQELITVSSNKLPIKIIIMNNKSLGMVRQWQKFFYKKKYSQTVFLNKDQPNFQILANAYKIPSIIIENRSQLFEKLKMAIENKSAYLIDIKIDPEYDVYPMVPTNASNDKMIFNILGAKK